MTPDRPKAARDLLDFYMEAGADALLGEAPVDRFADQEPARSPRPARKRRTRAAPAAFIHVPKNATEWRAANAAGRKRRPPRRRPTSPPPTRASRRGKPRASTSCAGSWRASRAASSSGTPSSWVFADGNPEARLMFVGEAPGREEDLEGLPFVGRSGKLLDLMIKAIGLDRTTSYIANIIPWRPPGNRTPTPQESQICLPFILRQIELVDPDILVCLGGPSSQTLLGFTEGIMKTRGRWLTFNTGTRDIRAIATLHPAYLLRQPLHKRPRLAGFSGDQEGAGAVSCSSLSPRLRGEGRGEGGPSALTRGDAPHPPSSLSLGCRHLTRTRGEVRAAPEPAPHPRLHALGFDKLNRGRAGHQLDHARARPAGWAIAPTTAAVNTIVGLISGGSGPTSSAPAHRQDVGDHDDAELRLPARHHLGHRLRSSAGCVFGLSASANAELVEHAVEMKRAGALLEVG